MLRSSVKQAALIPRQLLTRLVFCLSLSRPIQRPDGFVSRIDELIQRPVSISSERSRPPPARSRLLGLHASRPETAAPRPHRRAYAMGPAP
ncbi:hypothetical protein VDGE_30055 [Verticillium dahliae]|uniref:Uncharacterized protein n=1 Tax=Verticillium dahliae TaxID=27337 RepID=A0A444RUV4_VERDA|nr:hypothetical protein VDGE_30055 [Verticillium dahliae]